MTLMLATTTSGISPFFGVCSFSKGTTAKLPTPPASGTYFDMDFSPDGTMLALGGANTMQVRNTSDWTDVSLPAGMVAAGAYVSFSPDGTTLACMQASGAQPYLRIFRTSDWGAISIPSNVTSAGYGVKFSPDGKLLAVAHASAPFLTVYDTADWSKKTLSGGNPPGAVKDIAFSPDSKYLACACDSASPRLVIYDTTDWSKKTGVPTPPSASKTVAFSQDGAFLAVGVFSSPYLMVYRTSDWDTVSITGGGPAGQPNKLSFSKGGHLAVAHQTAPSLTVYDSSTWEVLQVPVTMTYATTTSCVAFNHASPLVIRGSVRDVDNNVAARTVRVLERSSGQLCATTTSDPVTGDYSVKVYEGDVDYDVQFMAAPGELLNDLFFARVRAGAP